MSSTDPKLGKGTFSAKRQMYHCVVTTCLVKSETKKGLIKFPDSPDKCAEWAESLRLQSWRKTSFVCPAHFSDDDFHDLPDGGRRIKKDRVPKVTPMVIIFILTQCLKILQNVSFHNA